MKKIINIFLLVTFWSCETEKKIKPDYFLTADQGTFKLQEFISFDNKRVINVGISEQLLISFASGISGAGNIVYIYAISSFLIFRAFEQLKVNLILNNPNVKIIAIVRDIRQIINSANFYDRHNFASPARPLLYHIAYWKNSMISPMANLMIR